MESIRKGFLYGFLGVAGIVLAIIGMFNFFARDWVNDQLRPQIQQELTKSLKRPVVLGPVLELWPGQVRLGPSTVQGLGRISGVGITFNPWDVGRTPIALSLELDQPDLRLERDRAGRWAIEDILKALPKNQAALVVVERVQIRNGRVRVEPAATSAFTLEGINGTVQGTERLLFQLTGTLDRAPWRAQGDLSPSLGLINTQVQLQGVPVGDAFGLLGLGQTFALAGRATGTVLVRWGQQPLSWDGQLNLVQGRATINGLNHPLVNLRAQAMFQGQDIHVAQVAARFGELDLTAQGKLLGLQRLDLAVGGKKLTLAQLQKTFNLKLPIPVLGVVNSQAGIRGPLEALVAQGTFRETALGRVDRVPLDHYQGRYQVTVNRALLTFKDVQIQGGGGRATAGGQVQLSNGQYRFDGVAQELRGAELWQRYQGDPRQRIGSLTSTFQFTNAQNRFDWQLKGGDWPGAGQLVQVGNRFDLTDTTFQKAGGTLAVQAALVDQQWTAQLGLGGLRLEQLFPTAEVAGVPWRGPLAGTVALTGQWGQFQLDQIRGTGQINLVQGFGLVDAPLSNRFTWDGQVAQLVAQPGPVQASGQVRITPQLAIPAWDLTLKTQDFAITHLLAQLKVPVPVLGRATIKGRLTGSPQRPYFQGGGRLTTIQVARLDFRPLTGLINWTPERAAIDLRAPNQRIALTLNPMGLQTLRVQRGPIEVVGNREGNQLVGTLARLPLEIADQVLAEPLPLGLVRGEAGGTYGLSLSGPRQFEANLTVQRGRWGRYPLDNSRLVVRYQANEWQLTRFTLGSLTVRGVWNTVSDRIEGSVTVARTTVESVSTELGLRTWTDLLDLWQTGLIPTQLGRALDLMPLTAQGLTQPKLLARLKAFAVWLAEYRAKAPRRRPGERLLGRLSGTFQGQVLVTGYLRKPEFRFVVEGNRWRGGGIEVDNLALKGSFAEQVLRVNQLDFALANRGQGQFQGQLSPKGQTGMVRIVDFPVELIQPFLPSSFQLGGNLSLSAQLGGDRQFPSLRGDFSIAQATLNQVSLKQAQGGLGYREGRLTLLDVQVATEAEPARINGSFPLPAFGIEPTDNRIRMQLAVKNNALGLIKIFTDQVQWLRGEGSLDLQIGGTTNLPTLQGSLVVQGADLTLTGFGEPLTGIEARVVFLRDRARVEQLVGRLSGGQLEATPGMIALNRSVKDLPPLMVNLQNLKIKVRQGYEGEAAGQLLIGGSVLNPEFGGQVILSNGRFSIPDQKTLAAASRASSVAKIESPKLDNLQVILGDRVSLLQPPALRVDTQGYLILNGTLLAPTAEGTIKFVRGRLSLFANPFYLDSAQENTARFRPESGLNPELDILAFARVTEVNVFNESLLSTSSGTNDPNRLYNPNLFNSQQTIRISARVTGRATQPDINLRSVPPRSERDILALLGGINSADSLVGAGAAFVSSPLLAPLEDFFLENLSLDQFRVSPTTRTIPGSPGAFTLGVGLEVGKDLNRNLSVSVTQSLTDPTQRVRVNLRYRLSDEFNFRLSTDFFRDVSGSIEFETRF